MNIRTSTNYAPRSMGTYNWAAWDDENDGRWCPICFGDTEAQAIANLVKLTKGGRGMSDDHDDWTARDEAEWERQDELRHEYAEDEYEARRTRNAHRCQCSGEDWPGSCPGPANCPLADHDDDATEEYLDNGPTDPWQTSGPGDVA